MKPKRGVEYDSDVDNNYGDDRHVDDYKPTKL